MVYFESIMRDRIWQIGLNTASCDNRECTSTPSSHISINNIQTGCGFHAWSHLSGDLDQYLRIQHSQEMALLKTNIYPSPSIVCGVIKSNGIVQLSEKGWRADSAELICLFGQTDTIRRMSKHYKVMNLPLPLFNINKEKVEKIMGEFWRNIRYCNEIT